MQTYLVYYDETGDDGLNTASSDSFILTAIYMDLNSWKENYYKMKELRRTLKHYYGFHVSEEMHTKHFLADKDPFRKYKWSETERRNILIDFIRTISNLDIETFSVIIDKNKIIRKDYSILKNALTYSIQRIENTSNHEWNYIIITDEGRISPMRKTARSMCVYNPIQSRFYRGQINKPIENLIEDILDKNSKESYFIQICDFISYFTHLYFKCIVKKESLPNRVGKLIDKEFIKRTFATFSHGKIINEKATSDNKLGMVIYPK